MDFDGLSLCSNFGRYCCLSTGSQGLNSTSVVSSAVLRSRRPDTLGNGVKIEDGNEGDKIYVLSHVESRFNYF